MSLQEYRDKEIVLAEQVEEDARISTDGGVREVKAGSYLVYRNGVQVWERDVFESRYELLPESVSEARKFTPNGKTVDDVIEFFRGNPEEVERVQSLEAKGGKRKGIMEYEVRG